MTTNDDLPEDEFCPVEIPNDDIHKITEVELKHRLYGGVVMGGVTSSGIRAYNHYHLKHKQPWHCVTVKKLKELLLSWGVETARADKLAMEVGYAGSK